MMFSKHFLMTPPASSPKTAEKTHGFIGEIYGLKQDPQLVFFFLGSTPAQDAGPSWQMSRFSKRDSLLTKNLAHLRQSIAEHSRC